MQACARVCMRQAHVNTQRSIWQSPGGDITFAVLSNSNAVMPGGPLAVGSIAAGPGGVHAANQAPAAGTAALPVHWKGGRYQAGKHRLCPQCLPGAP